MECCQTVLDLRERLTRRASRSHFDQHPRPPDLFGEAIAGLLQRPARAALTAAGTVLGVGTLVAILGITGTATNQISTRFDVLAATQVTAFDARDMNVPFPTPALPPDAEQRAARLAGARASGLSWRVATATQVRANTDPGQARRDISIYAASPGLFQATDSRIIAGRWFDRVHVDNAIPVAVVGQGAATKLGINSLQRAPAVFIDGHPFTVIGILGAAERRPELLQNIAVPTTIAQNYWGPSASESDARLDVITDVGAAPQVASQLALALRPDQPTAIKVPEPPNPRQLRETVNTDLNALFLGLAAICLIIGAFGIANTTLISIMERVPEIGLRRALGAQRRHILSQFLIESATIGAFGGILGSSVGLITVVSVATIKNWTPVISPLVYVLAPLIGVSVGLAAGIYPATKAARIQPADALHR